MHSSITWECPKSPVKGPILEPDNESGKPKNSPVAAGAPDANPELMSSWFAEKNREGQGLQVIVRPPSAVLNTSAQQWKCPWLFLKMKMLPAKCKTFPQAVTELGLNLAPGQQP